MGEKKIGKKYQQTKKNSECAGLKAEVCAEGRESALQPEEGVHYQAG